MSRPTGAKKNSLKQPKEEVSVKYMHKPPTIEPNYGGQKRGTLLPKSKVSRVLLYDNATQDHMLDIKLAHIAIEKERIMRIINLHKRSFSMRQMKKQQMKQALSAGSKNHTGMSKTSIKSSSDNNTMKIPHIQRSKTISDAENEINDTSKSLNSLDGIKLPSIDDDKRHVIFKVRDKTGATKVYHTVDEEGIIDDLIPMHTLYPRLTDDPRFRSLQNLLVPLEPDTW